MDSRLRALLIISVAGGVALAAYAGFSLWETNPRWRFGDPALWPRYEHFAANVAFRYPPSLELIEPTDPYANPVSLVLKGERGETVLLQVGTWHITPPVENLSEAVDRYAAKRSGDALSLERESLALDGHEAALVSVDERGGRRVLEAFAWDAVTTEVSDDPTAEQRRGEIREISLQLAKRASPATRALYERAFRELLASLSFLVEEAPNDRPAGIPAAWRRYGNAAAGFSLWYPPEWVVAEERGGDAGETIVTFRPAQPQRARAEEGTAYTVRALPEDERLRLEDLDALYARPFERSAQGGSVSREEVSAPGLWDGISLEARQPFGGKDRLEHLLALRAFGGRSYVVSVAFADDESQDVRLRETRAMTRSLAFLPSR